MSHGATSSNDLGFLSQRLNERLEPNVRKHLVEVYTVLVTTLLCTASGCLLHLNDTLDLGLGAAVASLILVLGLHFYEDDGKNYYTRLVMLLTFGFCSGQSLGAMVSYVMGISPNMIYTAITGTVISFTSLSLAALLSERAKYLYLGGILFSIVNSMAVLSLCNMLVQSSFIKMTQLYVGALVMVGFIIYDTQNIVEKCRAGNLDVVQHSLDLFFDIISMFRRLLIILSQREESE